MTVNYTTDVASGGRFVCFWRVLIRWRGSLYKLIWQDLLCYCTLFVAMNYIHTHLISPYMQLYLLKVKGYLSANISMFPVPFVLSFFVDQVATKWWHQYQMLPSPDTLAIYTNATIPGKDDKSRVIRRTIVRYAVLSLVLTLRDISMRVKKRFPTIKHVEEAGFFLEEEKIHYEKLESQMTAKNWMPLVWAANVATHAKSLNKISSDHCLRLLITELTLHRDKLGTLVNYDLVNIPLVYTQTMVVVVVSYVIVMLISNQPVPDGITYNGVNEFTISSLTDFIIYVGLMKVAAVMLNPFGEDDDDFELNAIVDRHLTAAYMIVDEMHEEEPEVVKDAYWDEIVPSELPYTIGSMGYKKYYPNFQQEKAQKEKTQKSSKQSKRKSGTGRRSSAMTSTRNNGHMREDTRHTASLPNSSKNYLDDRYEYDSEEYVEIYEYPNLPKPNHLAQQPSTSKDYYQGPKRY